VSNDYVLDYALDTKTGMLCRTWEWEVKGAHGRTEVPVCLSFFYDNPDIRSVASPSAQTATPFAKWKAQQQRANDPDCARGNIKTAEQYLKCKGISK
jgi:hypothetical protein